VRLDGWRSRLVKAGVMSAPKSISLTRTYRHEPDHCLRALATLLEKPIRDEGSPTPATLDNDGKAKGDSADTSILSD
jgi:hypothetical protein